MSWKKGGSDLTHRLLEVGGHTVVLTDPDRRVLGDQGPTKAELLAYYIKVAPRIVPFLRGRPISTVLLPDQSTREFRFARTTPPGWPSRLPTYHLVGIGGRRMERYLTIPDSGTLAALVDYGCLSFHPWNGTAVAPLQPTQMVFNLDPEAIAFREVRNAALLLRDLLAMCGLSAWVKTSGGHGLHVLVPLKGRASFDDVRRVADTIVKQAIRREPRLFSRDPRRGKRRGRILIDTSRNDSGATIIAPYAVAVSGFVSALLDWDELRRPIYPEDFGMDGVLGREGIDLHSQAAFFAAEQSLEPLVQRKRLRRWSVAGRPHVHRDREWLLGNAPAVVGVE